MSKVKNETAILTHLQPSFRISYLSPLTSGEELQGSKVMHSSRVFLCPYLHPFLCKLGIHCFFEDIPNILPVFPMLLEYVKPMIKTYKCYIIKRIKCIYISIHQVQPYISMSRFVSELCCQYFTVNLDLEDSCSQAPGK